MKRIAKISDSLKDLVGEKETRPVIIEKSYTDNSVQAELRLWASWSIKYPVDEIHAPEDLAKNWPMVGPWLEWINLDISGPLSQGVGMCRGTKRNVNTHNHR